MSRLSAVAAAALAIGAVAVTGAVAARTSGDASRAAPARAHNAAQPVDTPAERAFLYAARAGTARYRDQQAAVRDGFRRVGVEFPAMGEHWVNMARIMADTLDAAQPPVLTYATVRGRPVLVGVAYTDLLSPGERPPAFRREAWHEHNGSITEESIPTRIAVVVDPTAPRLAILHAWAWLANPAGAFVTDNWTLPFERLGLEPVAASREVVGALSLAGGGAEYYRLAVAGDALSPADDAALERLLSLYADRVRAALRTSPGPALDAAAERRLAAEWDALWRDVVRALPDRAAAVDRVRAGTGAEHGAH